MRKNPTEPPSGFRTIEHRDTRIDVALLRRELRHNGNRLKGFQGAMGPHDGPDEHKVKMNPPMHLLYNDSCDEDFLERRCRPIRFMTCTYILMIRRWRPFPNMRPVPGIAKLPLNMQLRFEILGSVNNKMQFYVK